MLHDERLYSKKILMKQNEWDFKVQDVKCQFPLQFYCEIYADDCCWFFELENVGQLAQGTSNTSDFAKATDVLFAKCQDFIPFLVFAKVLFFIFLKRTLMAPCSETIMWYIAVYSP